MSNVDEARKDLELTVERFAMSYWGNMSVPWVIVEKAINKFEEAIRNEKD